MKPTQPKPTEEVKPSFDVNSYVNYAKSYAQSIGLELDSTATDCWDNPITANAKRTGIKDDIQSRLNRYKNVEGFTAVCVWAEKVSDTEYRLLLKNKIKYSIGRTEIIGAFFHFKEET